MANQQRGEVTIKLGDNKYTLRPTFEAMCEIEDRLDKPMLELVIDFQKGNMRFKSAAVIIWAGIHGHLLNRFTDKEKPTVQEIGESIRKDGMTNILTQGLVDGVNPLINFITRAVMGDEDPDDHKEVKTTDKDYVEKEVVSEDSEQKKLRKARRQKRLSHG
jgi:hypothetical protein